MVSDVGMTPIDVAHQIPAYGVILEMNGQAITFTNNDPVAHTSTSAGGGWDSGDIAPGGSFMTTLQQPGTYTYHCSIHPFMQGMVVVQG